MLKKVITKQNNGGVGYVDDLTIFHPHNVDYQTIIQDCKNEYKTIGLEVNLSKCRTTQNGGTIKFVGQEFMRNSPISRSEKLLEEI